MIELGAAAAAVSGLKNAFDLTKAAFDIQGAVKVQTKVIELQSQILSAQQSAMAASETQTSLVRRIEELESEIARLTEWSINQENYRLENIGSGSFVYSPKTDPTDEQLNYWLCVKCFEEKKTICSSKSRPNQRHLS